MATIRTRTIYEFMLLRMLSSSLEMVSIAGMPFVRQVRLSPHLVVKDHLLLLAAAGNITGPFRALLVTVPMATTLWACVVSHSLAPLLPGLSIALGPLQFSRATCLDALCGAASRRRLRTVFLPSLSPGMCHMR